MRAALIVIPTANGERRAVNGERRYIDAKLTVGGRYPVRRLDDFTGHRHEFFQAGARYDDRVSTTMRLLSDAHKPAAFVLSKLNIKMLPFDLEFFRCNYIIHDALGRGNHLTTTILHRYSHYWRRNPAK